MLLRICGMRCVVLRCSLVRCVSAEITLPDSMEISVCDSVMTAAGVGCHCVRHVWMGLVLMLRALAQDAGGSIYFPFFFFFSSRRRHTRLQGDWSSDVCSSD